MEDENKHAVSFYLKGRIEPATVIERISAGGKRTEMIVERPVHRVFFDSADSLLQRAALACVYDDSDAEKASLSLEWIRPPDSPIEPLPPLSQPAGRLGKEPLGPGALVAWLQPLLAGRKLRRRFSETGREEVLWVTLDKGRLQVTARRVVLRTSGRRIHLVELGIESDHEQVIPEALSEDLLAIPGVIRDERSALARRMALLDLNETAPRARRIGPRMVDRALAVIRAHWRHLKKQEAGTRLGLDREALHRMRVATRRLRVALRLFRNVLPARRGERLRMELGWLGNALGGIRDCDVQLEGSRYESEELSEGERAVIALVRNLLLKRRAELRRRLIRLLDSRRYQRLARRMQWWLARPAPRFPRARLARQTSVAVAPVMLRRRLARLIRMASALTPTSPEADFHQVRILAKRLRYAAEFFEPLYGDSLSEIIATIIQLQDILGAHQDTVVAVGLLQQAAGHIKGPREKSVPLLVALGQRIYAKQAEAKERRAAFLAAYKGFRGKKRVRAIREAFKDPRLV